MKIHYFQRYHEKENVATANTMLLLSRLYSFSPKKFYDFIKSEFFRGTCEPEIEFQLQVTKNKGSIPDAAITQEAFKVIVETKMTNSFDINQLIQHLNAFGNDEKNKVLISLAPDYMSAAQKAQFDTALMAYNNNQNYPVIHINTTFDNLASAISNYISIDDYEMQDILEDYLEYCFKDGLIMTNWKTMRVRSAGDTLDFNLKNGVYYDGAKNGFSPHDYLGLYSKKSVVAVGKIVAVITAINNNGNLDYIVERGDLTDERKKLIQKAIDDAVNYGYNLINERYFFVDKFYLTDFKKASSGSMRSARNFDLTQILGTNQIPATADLAKFLETQTWT